jgi:hypothetical protein
VWGKFDFCVFFEVFFTFFEKSDRPKKKSAKPQKKAYLNRSGSFLRFNQPEDCPVAVDVHPDPGLLNKDLNYIK